MLDIAFQPKQIELYRLVRTVGPKAPIRLGFGGARGGAKTGGLRRLMLARRYEHPRTTGFLIRKNWADLFETFVEKYRIDFPQMSDWYRASEHQYVMPNGSRIVLRYADCYKEVEQISRGPEAMDVFVDQAEQFTEQELVMLCTPNRKAGEGRQPGECKAVFGFNPGGPGTEYLRRIFWQKMYRGEEKPHEYAFIQAYGWDNYEWFRGEVDVTEPEFELLSSEERFQMFVTKTSYGRAMNALPPALRVGELLGSFESFSGQYFASAWDEQRCVLNPDQVKAIVKPWWTRWMAQDWGFGDHTAHGWFAMGKLEPREWEHHFGGRTDQPIEIIICYRELIAQERAEADLANDIVGATPQEERKYIRRFFLSQDAFGQRAKQQGANTIGEAYREIMRRYGLPAPEPADQDRKNGWRCMYNGLRQCDLRGTEISEERARQGPAVFISAECPEVISNIPMAIRDEDDIDDVAKVPRVLWEDVNDMIRYGLKSVEDWFAKTPLHVQREEVYHSFEDPTMRALAMKRFELANAPRRVSRGPRAR